MKLMAELWKEYIYMVIAPEGDEDTLSYSILNLSAEWIC